MMMNSKQVQLLAGTPEKIFAQEYRKQDELKERNPIDATVEELIVKALEASPISEPAGQCRLALRQKLWASDDNLLVDTSEAALMLCRKPSTLKKWRNELVGPNYLPGKPVTYRIGALKNFASYQETNSGRV